MCVCLCLCVCVCARARACVRACASVRACSLAGVCVCICACVSVRVFSCCSPPFPLTTTGSCVTATCRGHMFGRRQGSGDALGLRWYIWPLPSARPSFSNKCVSIDTSCQPQTPLLSGRLPFLERVRFEPVFGRFLHFWPRSDQQLTKKRSEVVPLQTVRSNCAGLEG